MRLVTIETFNNVTEASLVKMRLEEAGFDCVIANDTYNNVSGSFLPTVPGFQAVWLQVREEDLELAKEFLAFPAEPIDEMALEAAALAAGEEEDSSPPER